MASTTTSTIVTSVEDVKLKPWKYEGYPGFAKWMTSSDDFFVLRRFGQMNTRVLLLMQDRIKIKEEELLRIDEGARNGPDREGVANSLRNDPQEEREMILDELRESLNEYNQYLVAYAQIKSWKSAEKRQIENVEHWFTNHRTAICEEEQEFIHAGEDLTALRNIPKSPVRALLEQCRPLLLSPLLRKKKKKSHHVESATTNYHTLAGAFLNPSVQIKASIYLPPALEPDFGPYFRGWAPYLRKEVHL